MNLSNASLWTSEDAARATTGTSSQPWTAEGVSIDSRTLERGDLFVAIDGLNQDGHKYVSAAFAKGASAAVVHKETQNSDGPLLQVCDTLEALNGLGRAARERTEARIVAVTGSAGKTSTKEALKVALSPSGKTHASAASYNNLWGVPLSLARMPADTEYGVFEVGMNHPGEIAPLVGLVRPHVAIVTTIQPVHIEFFDNIERIADEKSEIFGAFVEGGSAIVNADNPHYERVRQHAEQFGSKRIIAFGEKADADARLISANAGATGSDVDADIVGHRVKFRIGIAGHHFVMNSLAVLAAVSELGADVEAAAEALGKLQPTAGRGARHEIELAGNKLLLIDESYNANPSSVAAALRVLSSVSPNKGGRHIAVLGDMLELGEDADAFHRGLSENLVQNRIDRVFLSGEHMAALWEVLPDDLRGAYVPNAEDLIDPLCGDLRGGDVVMVKGSLGSRMGKIVQHLLAHRAGAEATGGG